MQHGAEAAQEVRVYELSSPLPSEVRVVKSVIMAKFVQVSCQFFGGLEVIDVYVGMFWSALSVVFWMRAHHDRQDVSP